MVKSFYNILKYSNYKVLKCSKLVFKLTNLYKNKGSIFVSIYFTGFLIGFIIFCFRQFFFIQQEVMKLFIKEKIENKEEKDEKKDTDIESPIIYDKNKILEHNSRNIIMSKLGLIKKNIK